MIVTYIMRYVKYHLVTTPRRMSHLSLKLCPFISIAMVVGFMSRPYLLQGDVECSITLHDYYQKHERVQRTNFHHLPPRSRSQLLLEHDDSLSISCPSHFFYKGGQIYYTLHDSHSIA